ncbi:MAG: hypothetical protein AMDU1_APLC00016G0011 [Thermoplasmatales archaeon A-plasma]|nr:MAG: hypothetical protein AMDU1_APLC00016G0011 [Thermoplasmatales archaeon A-plasma]
MSCAIYEISETKLCRENMYKRYRKELRIAYTELILHQTLVINCLLKRGYGASSELLLLLLYSYYGNAVKRI